MSKIFFSLNPPVLADYAYSADMAMQGLSRANNVDDFIPDSQRGGFGSKHQMAAVSGLRWGTTAVPAALLVQASQRRHTSGSSSPVALHAGMDAASEQTRQLISTDKLECLDGAGTTDASPDGVQRIVDEWFEERFLQGKSILDYATFAERFKALDFAELRTRIAERLGAAALAVPVRIVFRCKDNNSLLSAFKMEPKIEADKIRAGTYRRVTLVLSKEQVLVEEVKGINENKMRVILTESSSLKIPEAQQPMFMAAWIRSKLFTANVYTPEGYAEILRGHNWKEIQKELRACRPDWCTQSRSFILISNQHGINVDGVCIIPAAQFETVGIRQQAIVFTLSPDGVVVDNVLGTHEKLARRSLLENLTIDFAEQQRSKTLAAWLENQIFISVPKLARGNVNKIGQVSAEQYLEILRTMDLHGVNEQLVKMRPDWLDEPQQLAFESLQDIKIRNLAIIPLEERKSDESRIQHVLFSLSAVGAMIQAVEGANADSTYAALVDNPRVCFVSNKITYALAQWWDRRVLMRVPRNAYNNGYQSIPYEQFLDILRTTDFRALRAELARLHPGWMAEARDFAVRYKKNGNLVGALCVVTESEMGVIRGSYQCIRFSVEENVCITAVTVNKSQYQNMLNVLATNPHVSVSSGLWAGLRQGRPIGNLLVRLSEFGRVALYDEVRAVLGYHGMPALDGVVTVDDEILQEAAVRLLVGTSQAFVAAAESTSPWPLQDRRFAMAGTLNDFVAHVPLERADAMVVSQLLIAAHEQTTDRALTEYARVLRLVGDSPIAELGWDAVFSPELRLRLREFAVTWFGLGSVPNPAHDYLRDPFNEIVGAFYWHLLQSDNHADMRWEIITHLFYQQRRGDTLIQFTEGIIKAGELLPETARAIVSQELTAFAAQRGAWDLDTEEPTRLVEGIVGGAARFLWNQVLGDPERGRMIETARQIFPQHAEAFTDTTNLAESLPQSLFFEVLGVMARELATAWHDGIDQRTLEGGTALLNALMGLGDESLLGFRRGFGEHTDARELIQSVSDHLMRHHEIEFRAWLEEGLSYEINRIVVDTYEIQIVHLRRADLLERLIGGLSLRETVNILRLFRTQNLTVEQERQRADGIWQRIEAGTAPNPQDSTWLYGMLSRLTAPRTGARIGGAQRGERWYLFEQWLTRDGRDTRGAFFDEVFAAVAPRELFPEN